MTNQIKKEEEKNKEDIEVIVNGKVRLTNKAAFITPVGTNSDNPWTPDEVDTLENDKLKTYTKLVEACRFFYKKDPLSSSTLNKLVEIGINDLVLGREGLNDNEFRIFEGLLPKLKKFAEQMALEYLKSGLVVPEISFSTVGKDQLKLYNIKKHEALTLPTMMWLRDPSTITINVSMIGSEVSYYVLLPETLRFFITNNGKYKDGTKDIALFEKLKIAYPEFVLEVKAGADKVLLDNKLVFRRKTQSYEDYPIPYLEPALEALKHKRNLRRMDYSLAARVISAILLFRLGSDAFPVTEDDSDTFNELKEQILYRDQTGKNVERIFQLFANHTLQVDWIMPDIKALIDDAKYKEINQEIIFALGFPRILITGETERTGTSDAEFAMTAPAKTMETFREEIIAVLQYIIEETARKNSLKNCPSIHFMPLNLIKFADFYTALNDLYTSGNLSRTTYADKFGLIWEDEINSKEKENKLLEEKGIEVNAPLPYSPTPGTPNSKPTATTKGETTEKPTKTVPKPAK